MEEKIKSIARRLYDASRGTTPSLFDRRRWKGKVMEWAMADEAFKTRLFHFVDVLPSLKDDTLVVRLLKEYFSGGPYLVKMGVKTIPQVPPFTTMASALIRANVRSLARQFIGGESKEEMEDTLNALRKEGFAFTVDLLGETVVSEKEADIYRDRYLEVIPHLHSLTRRWEADPLLDRDNKGSIPVVDISVKVSSFYSQLDPVGWKGSVERTKERLRPIFEMLREHQGSITFDMEHYYYKDITIAIFKEMVEEFEDVEAGIAIQTYLRDSGEDLEGLILWARQRGKRIAIRLVKGAYWDYEVAVNRQMGWQVPVFVEKEETDLNYEKLTALILENREYIRPAFATHNIRSISSAMAMGEELEVPEGTMEFQTLYGMAEPIRDAVKELGYRVRVYVPLGGLIPGMGYLIRRLLENTSNESFLKKSFVEKVPFEELMALPAPQRRAETEEQGFRNEPSMDFSKAGNRKRMAAGIEEVKKGFGREYPLYIGGEAAEREEKIVSTNPARPEEVVGYVAKGSREDAERAIKEARRAWMGWKETTPEKRASYLFRAAEMMREERFKLMALMVHEVGKTWKEADGDVTEAIDYLEYYGREMIGLSRGGQVRSLPGEKNSYLYEPRGVGVVISPWNFPLAMATGMVSAGLVTGNCIVFKPSSLSPVTGWRLSEILRLSGLPDGVLQFIPGEGKEVGDFLVAHPSVDFVAFTGSKEVGLRILESAGRVHPGQRSIKRVVAEMGGKNAIIVDETADMDEAMKGVIESAFGYQGQKCSACSRVILSGRVEGFVERLRDAVDSIRIGPPEDPDNFMGPLVDERAVEKVRGYIELGLKEASPILVKEASGEGWYVGPAVFTDVDPLSSPLAQEEIFGPVLVILRAADIDGAIELANATPYGLTGGIYSRSPENIEKARRRFAVGNLYINRKITGAIVGRQPFGGFAMSGVGSKAGGVDYLLQFMNPRTICENTMRRRFVAMEDGQN